MEKSIYQMALERMQPEEIDHHESDLYLKVTPISRELIALYPYKRNVRTFGSEGAAWFDIPFAHDPFWSKRNNKKGAK